MHFDDLLHMIGCFSAKTINFVITVEACQGPGMDLPLPPPSQLSNY